jgi:DNA-binding LacI/PurR family transcriptional regulator
METTIEPQNDSSQQNDTKKAPTLKDIAQRANVSLGAASVVLLGAKSNTRVSKATRETILAIAAELDYHPNAVAQALTRRTTGIIGVYVGGVIIDLRAPFMTETIQGLLHGCAAHGKSLLTHGQGHYISAHNQYTRIVNGQIDGLVIHGIRDDEVAKRLVGSRIPIVSVADVVQNFPCVTADFDQSGVLIAKHLADKGHRHILYHTTNPPSLEQWSSVNFRLIAFQQASQNLGIDVDILYESQKSWRLEKERTGVELSVLGSVSNDRREAWTEILLNGPAASRPTAIVLWNDFLAFDFLDFTKEHSIRVPDDIAVVGFDGYKHWPNWGPTYGDITTIEVPWADVSERALEHVLSILAGKEIPQDTRLPVSLRAGWTT